MAKAEAAAVPEMLISRRALPGRQATKASATMPPSDGPTTAANCVTPSETMTSQPARAMSSTAISGKSRRQASPVRGLMDAGPLEPKQLPSELTQTTKWRSVSMARPGPIICSHQPGSRLAGLEAACAVGESPVNSRMALLASALSSPQHS